MKRPMRKPERVRVFGWIDWGIKAVMGRRSRSFTWMGKVRRCTDCGNTGYDDLRDGG